MCQVSWGVVGRVDLILNNSSEIERAWHEMAVIGKKEVVYPPYCWWFRIDEYGDSQKERYMNELKYRGLRLHKSGMR